MALQTNQGDPDAASALYTEDATGLRSEEMILNMGPQHPSTHGVLRLVLTLDGETVMKCTPVIGYLHRGMEKIFENRPYMAGPRYIDNADYLSPMINEICLCRRHRADHGHRAAARARSTSALIVSELERIASHLVAVGTYGLDLGAFTPVLWAFRDREVHPGPLRGAQRPPLHAQLHARRRRAPRPAQGLAAAAARSGCDRFVDKSLPELEGLLTGNEIFDARTQGVGYIDPQQAHRLRADRADGCAPPASTSMCACSDPTAPIARSPCARRLAAGGRLFRALPRAHGGDGRECAADPRWRWTSCPAARSRSAAPIALRPPRGETYYSPSRAGVARRAST